eukprot:TRINITY_DN35535_c0_g1_i1.p2 TRINITY_DN35535_c0_g1~~TRINITY_DN35535_c0_g1_i1.p2  ORF type:complete len:106 (+),score=17.50 TRINITY_DN35535_c0_g1_i1:139-456(+)
MSNRAMSAPGRRHNIQPDSCPTEAKLQGKKVFTQEQLHTRQQQQPPSDPAPAQQPQKPFVATIHQDTKPTSIFTSGTGERGGEVPAQTRRCGWSDRGNGNILTWG